jgi:hypothetical protein
MQHMQKQIECDTLLMHVYQFNNMLRIQHPLGRTKGLPQDIAFTAILQPISINEMISKQLTLRQTWPQESLWPQCAFKMSMFNAFCNSH